MHVCVLGCVYVYVRTCVGMCAYMCVCVCMYMHLCKEKLIILHDTTYMYLLLFLHGPVVYHDWLYDGPKNGG